MTNTTSTKRALFTSVMSMLLCFTMLLGTTFAWFTDSAVSGSNVITAGNLDLEVQYTLDGENWASLDGATDLFGNGLWEPGHTEVVALKVTNAGSLALKYVANMNIMNETVGKTKDGADIVLSDILTVSTLVVQANDEMGIGDICLSLAFAGESTLGFESTATFKTGNVLRNDQALFAGDAHYIFIKVDMADTVGNEANHNGTDIPAINFGINVLASQYAYEEDTFGNQYDVNAIYPVVDIAKLAAVLKAGSNAVLGSDVSAPLAYTAIYGTPVAVIQKGGVFDGSGYSLDIINPRYEGYAVETWGGTIKNLVIDSTVGRGIVISSPKEDVYLDNVYVDGPGYALNTTEHNGKNLYVTNSTFKGWSSLAGLDSASFTGCTFGENTSGYWQAFGYDQDYDRLLRPYITTTLTACEFEQGFYLDLSALEAGCTVTLADCVSGGTEITEANFATYISIELPAGRTLADCVVFA